MTKKELQKQILMNLKSAAVQDGHAMTSIQGATLYEVINGYIFEIFISVKRDKSAYFADLSCKPFEFDDLFWEITENPKLSMGKRVMGAFTVRLIGFANLGPLAVDDFKSVIEAYANMKAYFGEYASKRFYDLCMKLDPTRLERNRVLRHFLEAKFKSGEEMIQSCRDRIAAGDTGGFTFVQDDGSEKSFFDYYLEYLLRSGPDEH